MLISRNWLQSHFATELPDAQKIADTLMMHSFEIEGIDRINNDDVIDIDVLPNRAHDCLSYAGIAREYSVLTGYELKTERYHYHDNIIYNDDTVVVAIKNPEQCYRYMARKINNIEVTDSPDWLRERIESMGQRSINNIVDATNYVMFDLGNPMHAFDADKVVGEITIRKVAEGETMLTLTGEEVELLPTDLVIADDEGILALAGVKGGIKAEVTSDTKNIILEVANFNPTTTRTTSRRVKILTDSSKRFENEITSELASDAMQAISRLVSDIMSVESMGGIVDIYPQKPKEHSVCVNHHHINNLLGLALSSNEVEQLFEKMNYQVHTENDIYQVHIPHNRLDLRMAVDIIEEIGRIYGYYNIPVKSLDDYHFNPQVNSTVYIENRLKNFFLEHDFSELKNYSFTKKGEREVKNPLSNDKRALRKNLHREMLINLEKNSYHADFLGTDRTAIFEIGRVYVKDAEKNICCIAIQNKDKKANKKYGTEQRQLEELVTKIGELFNVNIKGEFEKNSFSFDVDQINKIDQHYDDIFNKDSYSGSAVFHPISAFPYITRDISFWIDGNTSEEDLRNIIEKANAHYLQKIFLFDRFEKEGRVSYAFSLVFQSNEKTLTDNEVDVDMTIISNMLEDIRAEIR